MLMSNRRAFLLHGFALLLPVAARPAVAQSGGDHAVAFVKKTGDRILAAMRAVGSVEDRRRALGSMIDSAVDVDGVARFCLGLRWRTASPEQQKRYTDLFHQVLIGNITAKLGEYQDVRLTIGRSQPRDDTDVVTSVVERPNNPPTTVEWVVSDAARNPKIVDLIAENTSLRITQRSDYSAYLTRHNNDVEALINAMKQQLAANG